MRTIFSTALLALEAMATLVAATTPAERIMVPVSKRSSLQLRSRSLLDADAFKLRDKVTLSYGEESQSSPTKIYTADLTLHARANEPIVVVEDFEHLLVNINCAKEGKMMILEFGDVYTATLTLESWAKHSTFVLVTSHPEGNCNPQNDRAAFRVSRVRMPTHHALPGTLVLTIEKMPFPRAVKRMSVSIDNLEPEVYNRKLVRRQSASTLVARDTEEEDGFRGNSTVSFNSGGVGTRTKLYPLPLQETKTDAIASTDFQVHCIDCRTEGKVSISGELDIDSDFVNMNDGGDGKMDVMKVNTSWFQVTVEEDLRAAALLEVFFGGKLSFPEIEKSLMPAGPIPLSPFSLGSVLTVGPMLDLEIVFGLEAAATAANISFGTEITIPKGATAKIDYKGEKKDGGRSTASGWDKSKAIEIPPKFHTLVGDFSLTASISARATLSLGVTVFGGKFGGLGAGLVLDLPQLSKTGMVIKDVSPTGDCLPRTPADATYFPYALKQSTSLHLRLSAQATAELPGEDSKNSRLRKYLSVFNQKWKKPLYEKEFSLGEEKCLGYNETVNPIAEKAKNIIAGAGGGSGGVGGDKGGSKSMGVAMVNQPGVTAIVTTCVVAVVFGLGIGI